MPSERMTYPHRQRASGFPICLCGAMPGAGPTSTWGADCPVAMRAEIGRLTLDLDAALQRIAATVPSHEIATAYGARDDEAPDEWAARIVREGEEARTESDKRNVQLTAARERIADLERQITAATAVVHLTTGARP